MVGVGLCRCSPCPWCLARSTLGYHNFLDTIVSLHMAARKSCTKLTWAEAKARVGEESGVVRKKGEKPKKLSHVEKIIAKQTGTLDIKKENKAQVKKERRYDEKLAALAEKKAQARLKRMQVARVKTCEQARDQMSTLALQLQSEVPDILDKNFQSNELTKEELLILAQCRETQLNEIMALEAMVDAGDFLVCDSSDLDSLRDKAERYQMDNDCKDLQLELVNHNEISLLLKLVVFDEEEFLQPNTEASVLIQVTLPRGYPLLSETNGASLSPLPRFQLVYSFFSDTTEEVNADKQVESLAHIKERDLQEALLTQARDLLPDLCVYEVAVSWLSENLFKLATS